MQDRGRRSTEALESSADPAAPRVGAELAQARERLCLSVDEVGASLRIRAAYLTALEQGRVGEVPGGTAYALAFLRSYASALGLDPEAMVRRFKVEAAAVLSRKTELAFPTPAPGRRVPAGAAALLATVLAIGVYAGWYRLSGEGQLPAETVAEVPAHLIPLVAPLVVTTARPLPEATPVAAAVASVDSAPAQAGPSPLNALAAERPTAAVSPGSAAAAMPTAAMPVAAIQAPPASAGEEEPPHLVVRAIADSWLQVRDRAGATVFSRVLRAGESWPVPSQPGLILTTGNAGGTVLVVDGVASGPLGAPGAVRRDLALDPEEVRAGRLAAIATPR